MSGLSALLFGIPSTMGAGVWLAASAPAALLAKRALRVTRRDEAATRGRAVRTHS
jgi:hypothetical protein